LQSFIVTLGGSYSGSTLANYYYGVRAWHILHALPWAVDQIAIDAMLKAAASLVPQHSKWKKTAPIHC
ncbi:hypothetical protein B0H10DRAFT_1794350, partial [Mycena sp. CBHHK59/15]